MKERNYYLDNCKVFLIILVDMTHFTGPFQRVSQNFLSFAVFTNAFYMAAFVLISGYFSKRYDFIKSIKTLLIPYLIMQAVCIFVDIFITHSSNSLSFIYPKFTLWYLLCLFGWRVLTNYIGKTSWLIPISILISLGIGYVDGINKAFSLSRFFYFYPFFLSGYFLEDINRILKWKKPIIIVASFLILCTIFFYMHQYGTSSIKGMLEGSAPYSKYGINALYRLFAYGLAYLMTFCFAMIVPRKKWFFSYLGKRTMSIYIFHGVIYQIISKATPLYDYINKRWELIIFMVFLLFLVWVLGTKPFVWLTNKISSFPIERVFFRKVREIG